MTLGCWFILLVPLYLLITDFLQMWKKIPLLKSKYISLKIIVVILYLLLFLWVFSLAINFERHI